jgi:DNA-binding NtrC family response regulator
MTAQAPVLLVVDDNHQVVEVLGRFAQRLGFEVVTSSGGAAALDLLRQRGADVALVDLRMPDVGGLDVLRQIKQTQPECRVILITGFASIETAVEAVKLGAMDYLSKPVSFSRLEELLASVREEIDRRRSLLETEAELARRLEFSGMTGRSPAMQELFGLVRRLAPHLRTALVTGETGTGKQLVARALHDIGPRRDRPFVIVTCTAVHEASFEASLFGCVAGVMPGAVEARQGLLDAADGGTVFLDEVSELPLSVQARLLRVIECGELHRVGSLEERRVDLQVIAATQRDLREEVAGGRFRSDLFYRLNVVEIGLPPLRQRREDIPYLTAAFVKDCAARLGKPIRGVGASAEALLAAAPWEGNVRELRNVIERACLLADGEFITEREVSSAMPPAPSRRPLAVVPRVEPFRTAPSTEEDAQLLSTVEREHILRALQRSGGNKKAAARMLGVSRRALYRRLERLELGGTISRRRPSHIPDRLEA